MKLSTDNIHLLECINKSPIGGSLFFEEIEAMVGISLSSMSFIKLRDYKLIRFSVKDDEWQITLKGRWVAYRVNRA